MHQDVVGEDIEAFVLDQDRAQFRKDGSISREFTNERGNLIRMEVRVAGDDTIRIVARGPTSTCDHTWTHEELQILVELVSTNTRLRREVDAQNDVMPPLADIPDG